MGFSEQNLIEKFPFSNRVKFLADVGAHHGSFSIAFAKKGWKVIAFEPESNNRAAFAKNLMAFPDVLCVPKAVSDVSGEKVPFYVSSEHFGIHSLMPFHPTHEEAYEVETIRLDDALKEFGVERVALLKIDTEGADFLALKGFDVAKHQPELIMLEFMDERSQPNYGYTHHDVVSYMKQFDYVAYVSEWAPIKEYGREGVRSDPHTWLQCVQYPLDHPPAWGNLIFVIKEDEEKFHLTLEEYLSNLGSGEPSTFINLFKKVPGAVWLYKLFFGN